MNVEKYCITALRVGPARAVIGASSIVHTPSVAICLVRSFAVRALRKRGLCAARLWTSYESLFYSVLFGRRALHRCPASPVIASTSLLPSAEVQSAGLSETLLLSLWPRSCRTLAPASQLSIRLTHSGFQVTRPVASLQSFGYVEGIASLSPSHLCRTGRWKVAP